MRIRRLQIESWQMARLSVEAQMARLSINAPMRRIKSVQQQRAEMTVNNEKPSIEVDMTALRNNIGLKNAAVFMQDSVSAATAQAKQGIKNIENNGDDIAALPRSGNPIAQISRAALVKAKATPTPSGRPKDPTVDVKGNPGSFNIDWSIQDISITWDDYQAPIITIEPKPSVDVVLAQKPYLEFKVVEQTYPPETGRKIDQAG